MATDGAVGGAVDNAFRTAYDGGSLEEVGTAAVEGFVGGAIMSPVIGGGMKEAGVAFNRIKGIDEFSSLVTNCKNLGDEDLLNLYQYYKNYEQKCILNNNPVPDMKQAGFDKLMEEINSRGLNVEGSTSPHSIEYYKDKLRNNPTPQNSNTDFGIPKGRLRAPRAGFDETMESYINIIRDNQSEISDMCAKYQRGVYNEEEFAEVYAKFLAEKMDMPYYPELRKVVNNDYAGGMQNTTNTLYYNLSGMERISDLMGTINHEMHHFLQQKEIFSTISIEEYSALKAKADVMSILQDNPQYYKSRSEITNAIAEQTKAYINDFKNAGWEQVLKRYPKNTNQDSPYTIRAKELLDADLNYIDDRASYYSNLLEREAHEIGTRTQVEIEYSILHEINQEERDLALEIYDKLNFPTFNDVDEAQEILHIFEAHPYNLIEIVKEAKIMGLDNADDIIERII